MGKQTKTIRLFGGPHDGMPQIFGESDKRYHTFYVPKQSPAVYELDWEAGTARFVLTPNGESVQ